MVDILIEPGCETNEWAQWTSCSVTCGKGISMRQRGYADAMKAKKMGCGRQLVQKEMCAASVALCEGKHKLTFLCP